MSNPPAVVGGTGLTAAAEWRVVTSTSHEDGASLPLSPRRPIRASGSAAASRPCHCSMSTRDGTTTSTNRPRRNASDAAAIATSVFPEPVTASITPRRPQRNQLTSASSCHR